MKTVLIVDDEYYIRKRVRNCIDWNEFGYVIEEAEDGKSALGLLCIKNIELAVIDISMPNMDGLKLAEEIKNRQLSTRVIILTGYAKFEYAKSAIKCDVDFYLLKPVDEEEMKDAVISINKMIDKTNEEKQKLQQSIEHQRQSELLLKSIFFKNLFAENTNKKSRFTEDQLLDYQIDINISCCVVIYDIKEVFSPSAKKHLPDNAAVENILYESIGKIFKLVITTDIFERRLLIINLLPDQMKLLHDVLSNVYENIWTTLNCIAVFNCSRITRTSINGIVKAYKEAEATYLLRIFDDSSQKICYFANNNDSVIDSDIQNEIREIEQIMKSNNILVIKEKIHAFVLLLKAKKVSYFDLVLVLDHLILIAKKVYFTNRNSVVFDGADIVTAHEILRRCDNLTDFEDEILTLFNAVTAGNLHMTVVSGTQIMNRVNKLIETHYCESRLTVNFIAEKLFLSPAYLSTTYKKYSGVTIMQYITQCRMEQAKILLEKLHINISQIAEMVGYNDAFHFSKRFKQYFGQSPSSYKLTL